MKAYYSIKEVADMLKLKPYVLRFWEKMFKEISPRKHRGNRRMYVEKDIEQLKIIKHLLYEKGFTIEGAKKYLKQKESVKQLKIEFNEKYDNKYIAGKLNEIIKLIKK